MSVVQDVRSPVFDDSDLLMYCFDGAELTLPALRIPLSDHNIEDISTTKNFCGIDTSGWDVDDCNHFQHLLLLQHWNLEHIESLDDIATGKLWVNLVEMHESVQSANSLLSNASFEKVMVNLHAKNFRSHDEAHADDLNIPSFSNYYFGKSIPKRHLNWFVVSLPLKSASKPTQLLMIPINNRFVLMAYIKIESLHYEGRTNPYSDETLKQFEKELFDEFLNHIKIDYSPKLIEKIQSLKTTTPA